MQRVHETHPDLHQDHLNLGNYVQCAIAKKPFVIFPYAVLLTFLSGLVVESYVIFSYAIVLTFLSGLVVGSYPNLFTIVFSSFFVAKLRLS